jgi:hypothetical protein
MRTYRYLSIKNHAIISDKLYQFVQTKTDILEKKWSWTTVDKDLVLAFVPELASSLELFVQSNKIAQISFIYRPPGSQGPPHIDSKKLVRILWPVKNCEGSYTKFFDLNNNEVVSKLDEEGNTYLHINDKNPMPEIHAVELNRPIVFDTGVPHGVYTNPRLTGPRISATISFDKQPKHLLIY